MDLANALEQALLQLNSGANADCIESCNKILAANPGLIRALYLRGCAAFQAGSYAQAANDLGLVFDTHPEHSRAAFDLGRSLHAIGRLEEALPPLQAAFRDEELALQCRYLLAVCLTGLRRRPEAIEHYLAILSVQPGNEQVAANVALLLERENRLDEAATWVDRALSLNANNETARLTRATLDRRNGDFNNAGRQLRALIPEIDNPTNRSIACNQLGRSLEGLQKWDEAFAAFSESNRALQEHYVDATPDPSGPHGLQTMRRIREWLENEPMAGWSQPVAKDDGGIAFLVGFPRSGTTLLHTMLAAHPDVEVLEEKSLFTSLHQDWASPGTLEALAEVSEAQILDARTIYRQEMSRHRHEPARRLVIDKLPLNLAYLFLVYRFFPDAPVIFLQRDPFDTCTSCFFQAFELRASMGYFLDIGTTAEYYDAVMGVAMPSMDQVGNPLHVVRYEDLVAAPRKQLTALFDFLELPMHDSALDHRVRGDIQASNTPSYEQVYEPLYERSIGRWRHYSRHLEPYSSILQPWSDLLGYD